MECVARAAWSEPLHSACASVHAKCAPRAIARASHPKPVLGGQQEVTRILRTHHLEK